MSIKFSKCIDHARQTSLVGAGYAHITYKGKLQLAHRVAYCEARQIPITHLKGSVVRHTCDNPRCINPQHLLIGTQQDNVADRKERGRCAKGQTNSKTKLTIENVLEIRRRYVARCKVNGGCALGREFGVRDSTISRLIDGTNWQHA